MSATFASERAPAMSESRVLDVIRQAGESGLVRADIARLAELSDRTVSDCLRRLRGRGKVKRSYRGENAIVFTAR